MAFVWKPAIWDGSALFQLPRPIEQLTVRNGWDVRESKVPLKDGGSSIGHSRNAVEIQVAGWHTIDEGTAKFTEETQFALYEELVGVLDVSSDASDRYEFFLYHDSGSATYRKYKNCWTRSFSSDFGDQARVQFPYSITIVADDPVIYTTAPGS